jgi:hypothetical protein
VNQAAGAELYAARAIDYFRQSVAKGVHHLPLIKSDPALDALRGREDFKKRVAEAEKKIRRARKITLAL